MHCLRQEVLEEEGTGGAHESAHEREAILLRHLSEDVHEQRAQGYTRQEAHWGVKGYLRRLRQEVCVRLRSQDSPEKAHRGEAVLV